MRRPKQNIVQGKKLTLSKETLKKLTQKDLIGVAGGGQAPEAGGPTALDCSVGCTK